MKEGREGREGEKEGREGRKEALGRYITKRVIHSSSYTYGIVRDQDMNWCSSDVPYRAAGNTGRVVREK